jgi:hypothetical protein
MSYIIVFIVMTLTDFVWAQYTAAIAKDKAFPAGLWSIGIILFGSYVTKSYVDDYWMIIPASIGAFAGTFLSVKLKVGR